MITYFVYIVVGLILFFVMYITVKAVIRGIEEEKMNNSAAVILNDLYKSKITSEENF